jgi:hypothetical protein
LLLQWFATFIRRGGINADFTVQFRVSQGWGSLAGPQSGLKDRIFYIDIHDEQDKKTSLARRRAELQYRIYIDGQDG